MTKKDIDGLIAVGSASDQWATSFLDGFKEQFVEDEEKFFNVMNEVVKLIYVMKSQNSDSVSSKQSLVFLVASLAMFGVHNLHERLLVWNEEKCGGK